MVTCMWAAVCCLAWQAAFVADDVSNIIKESIDAVLQNQQYNENKVRNSC